MFRRNASQVFTFNQNLTHPLSLGQAGIVSALKYSYKCPGGPDQMSCTLTTQDMSARNYSRTVRPGRIVQIMRGACSVWEGIMDEPVPGQNGWDLTAHGSGTYGDNYQADTSTWDNNAPVNAAIARGLRWRNPGISGGWVPVSKVDNFSEDITTWLDNLVTQAGMLWYVDRFNILKVFNAPINRNPTRCIININPPMRNVNGVINHLYYRYVNSTNNRGKTTYATDNVANSVHSGKFGPMEGYLDMSQGGLMTATQAKNNATYVMNQYQSVSYSGPITVSPGMYTTIGGQPVDLGCERAGIVAKFLIGDTGFGGDLMPQPVTFIVGGVDYDDEAGTADITPLPTYRTDLGTLLAIHRKRFRQ